MSRLFDKQQILGECPNCQVELVIRKGMYGSFKCCPNYPTCHFIEPLAMSHESYVVKEISGKFCSLCRQILVLRRGRYGMFICCIDYPHCHYIETEDKPDEITIHCPQCKAGQLIKRQSRQGKSFYACNSYPNCRFTINTIPVSGDCPHCHYSLLTHKQYAGKTRIICANKRCGKSPG